MAAIDIKERQFDYGPQRESWVGSVPVSRVLKAARERLAYHERRLAYWKRRYSVAAGKVRRSLKVKQVPVTAGFQTQYDVDASALEAKQLAEGKVARHQAASDAFREWVTFLELDDAGPSHDLRLTFSDAQFFGLSGHQPDDE